MTRVTSVGKYARFWAVDFHVHTPGSQDAKAENYGSAEDIVSAAIAAGLDAIAITDHNTVAWCSAVAEAASGTSLVVLPGVEISTTEGHLLAIWEEGTAPTDIEELLVKLEIGHAVGASSTSRPRLDSPTRHEKFTSPVASRYPLTRRRKRACFDSR